MERESSLESGEEGDSSEAGAGVSPSDDAEGVGEDGSVL